MLMTTSLQQIVHLLPMKIKKPLMELNLMTLSQDKILEQVPKHPILILNFGNPKNQIQIQIHMLVNIMIILQENQKITFHHQ